MLRDNKSHHSPDAWSIGILHPLHFGDEAEFRSGSAVLQDRYRRGMTEWSKLLDLPWWAWRRDRIILRRLEALRGEYCELLETLVEARRRSRIHTHVVNMPYPSKLPPMRTPERRVAKGDPAPYAPTYSNYQDDEDRKRTQTTSVSIIDDPNADAQHFRIDTFSPGGGDFGGAGASGSWDSGSSDSLGSDSGGSDSGSSSSD